MRSFGLIGFPLSHSFSKTYFTEKFQREQIQDATYENFEISSIQGLEEVLQKNPQLVGLNVTIPYKEAVIPLLDELDEYAMAIGAANTIKITSGKRKGYNTDYVGFLRSLIPLLKPWHTKALILGTGGSSLAVRYAMKKLGIGCTFVSRNPEKENEIPYSAVSEEKLQEHTVIVNTTPKGMFPETADCADIPYQFLTRRHLLFDLIYNPTETLFLKKGKEKNSVIKNGHEMLTIQAELSWKIWTNF